ncbi:MAG TPA: hypothetical protein VJS30_06080 [Paraburkholderia sp.]|nr:hypothetical protein [Paraburkholderia sp.]
MIITLRAIIKGFQRFVFVFSGRTAQVSLGGHIPGGTRKMSIFQQGRNGNGKDYRRKKGDRQRLNGADQQGHERPGRTLIRQFPPQGGDRQS